MRASALLRSVMSSSSRTVPPPVIGWNVQDERAAAGEIGIGRYDVAGLRMLDFGKDDLAALNGNRSGSMQAIRCRPRDPTLNQIVRQGISSLKR